MKHRNDQKVVVAYPRPDLIHGRFARCLLDLWRYDAIGGRDREGKKVGGRQRILVNGGLIERSTALLTRARTDIVADFLAMPHEPDWLWMVDTDMTFTPDIVDRLIAAAHPEDRPVIGGLCFSYTVDQPRKFSPTLYSWDGEWPRRMTQYPDDTLIPVASTGAACLLVHRTVLEAMRDRYGMPRPWFAETDFIQPNGTPDTMSEDMTFCIRVQACGFPVHVHTGIKLGHLKQFEANEETFIAECASLAMSTPQHPTFAVVASKSRTEMLSRLHEQLAPQTTDQYVYDNGYAHPPASVPTIEAHDWPLHRMWNDGLDRAEKEANGQPHNVLVINDDVVVAPDFVAQLEAGLRSSDDNWVAYCGDQGQTGWAMMLRGEAGLRFDEQFEFWYGDTDLAKQVAAAGKRVVSVPQAQAQHLDPMRSTTDPVRLAQAKSDEAKYAAKWKLDPNELWLAKHPEFGQ